IHMSLVACSCLMTRRCFSRHLRVIGISYVEPTIKRMRHDGETNELQMENGVHRAFRINITITFLKIDHLHSLHPLHSSYPLFSCLFL
ncbi:hypothetical protein B0T10DRAFT_497473, partial [Thelonectria olida]